ncbi:TPA: restriction endonuclease subunit S [Enterococcus faecium]|uniref:Type I restriction-modification system, specificity subunit S n=1 Tax=Enterococcus faecium TaxID=1352 RepID=A0A2S0T1H8_ENTFC|nr:restriction endonuclease subunit S [Enterococcus faecium]AWB15708.1 Type I restriction-modification system, specificity subunit S [Enterococcus faecium]EKZ0431095.1 restriction endonuclease subunit S [Enterococcus faecium]ELZ1276710.1 restriction endonuclease subunit S [Enterococcus faecium]EME7114200.1 restriction endonuclease subunit S [Enterococcus faecium]MDE5175468.1 restriction endonuclease subunit S [Enterococcus faecium]
MSNNTQPEIRFPGFMEDWEQRKLGDFIDVKSGKDYKHLNSGSIPVYGTGGYMLSVDRALSDIDAIGIGRKGTIDKPYLLKAPFWTVDTLFYAVPKQNIDLQFSLSIFKKINWKKFDESTGVPSLSKTVINSVGASVPSYEEQKKIGSFFKQLDETIALHQRKLDLLKETKKGFLQKMFPKNGAKVPEIRFPGFTEDWEQRKLGELATIVRGASPRPIQDPKWFDTESDVGWLRIADVTEQDGRIYYLEQHISKLGQEKTRVLVEPHLLLSIAATVGKPVVNYVKTGVHDGFLIFLNAIFDREFMFQWLEMFRPKWQKYGQPGSQVNLNSELVRNQEILIPNNEEQQKIGSFFKQLDTTITLHQRELDVLKETKKGFLQKMFV